MSFCQRVPSVQFRVAFLVAILATVSTARAQSALPALFATDHIPTNLDVGNFASVKSFTIDVETGDLTPVGTYFTNDLPYELALSPNGRYLAVGHASALTNEDLIIFRVHSDASLTEFAVVTVASSPFEIAWIDNETLAVLETSDLGSAIWTYNFDPEAPLPVKVTPIDNLPTGSSGSYDLALHPTRPYIFVPNSPLFGGTTLNSFHYAADGDLSLVQTINISSYGLDTQITPNGRFMYVASGTGDTIQGFAINQQTGTISPMGFGGFPVFDGAPSHIQITPDGALLFLFCGNTETIRSFTISPDDGFLFDTGHSVVIGDTAFNESIEIYEDILFVTRNKNGSIPAGILRYRIHEDGSFTPIGDLVESGARLYFMETWTPQPITPGDMNADGVVNLLDIPAYVAALLGDPFEPEDLERADVNLDGAADGLDTQPFVEALLFVPPTGACCSMVFACNVTTEADCFNQLQSEYLGDDTDCADCPPIPPPTIDSVFAGNPPPYCNEPPLNIAGFFVSGSNFGNLSEVRLTSDGLPDVVPVSVEILDPGFLAVDFDLEGAVPGVYQLRVTNPDGQFALSMESFTIEDCD